MKTTRRSFIKSASVFTAAGLSVPYLFERCGSGQQKLKNVIVLIGDDHAASVLGCYGNTIVRTPNLDKMASRGVRFSTAFANAPLCSASRQSLLTGRYPHATGVTLLRTPFPADQVTIAEHLKERGYVTGVIGKTHFNDDLPHGFNVRITARDYQRWLVENPPQKPPQDIKTRPKWRPFVDPARIWLNADMLPSEYYDKDCEGKFLADQAIKFLHENKINKFCLWVGFHEPHSPFHFPIEYMEKYNPENMPLPETGPEDDRWIPEIFRDLSESDKRGIIVSYYTSVEHLDKNIGLILSALEELQLDSETLVVYIGDQGYLIGDHKRFEKHMMWDPAIRSPLIFQAGGRYGPARVIDALTEFVDLAPTILDILDVDPMPDAQGRSFKAVLDGSKKEYKDYVFSEFLVDNKSMVRSKEWKYIYTTGERDLGQGYTTGYGPSGVLHRLYNVANDPFEKKNLADGPRNTKILSSLKQRLLEWFKNTHPHARQIPDTLSVDEQLARFCIPPDKNADIEAH
ncbi:sulfatase-like hydrolase/transferase [candidate division KSB1 bacterium]|nr:sulfatase-like hydrolase/transferase [candidate division KSB1 bacterium]